MTRTKIIAGLNGGIVVPLSAQEEADRDAQEAVWAANATIRANAQALKNRKSDPNWPTTEQLMLALSAFMASGDKTVFQALKAKYDAIVAQYPTV